MTGMVLYRYMIIGTNSQYVFFITQITSLTEIRENPHYRYLKRLQVSDNLIESLAGISGSAFITNTPTLLDISYNKLKKVKKYTIESFRIL